MSLPDVLSILCVYAILVIKVDRAQKADTRTAQYKNGKKSKQRQFAVLLLLLQLTGAVEANRRSQYF